MKEEQQSAEGDQVLRWIDIAGPCMNLYTHHTRSQILFGIEDALDPPSISWQGIYPVTEVRAGKYAFTLDDHWPGCRPCTVCPMECLACDRQSLSLPVWNHSRGVAYISLCMTFDVVCCAKTDSIAITTPLPDHHDLWRSINCSPSPLSGTSISSN